MDKDSMYVKIWAEHIKHTGKVDCGCEIIEVDSPHVTMKLCKKHGEDVKSKIDLPYVSPCIHKPEEFESVYLAAIPQKTKEDEGKV